MSYFLFKLKFTAPVHFGPSDSAQSLYSSRETFCADTLFSALCHTALRFEGEAGLEELLSAARSDRLRLSDAMPWRGEQLFLPKPFFYSEARQAISAEDSKVIKKLRWVPVSGIADLNGSFVSEGLTSLKDKQIFGVHGEYTRVSLKDGIDALPYQVGTFHFFDDCGLWFICSCPEDEGEHFEKLLELLGLGGIGGKTSSGYGSFQICDSIFLDEPFDDETQYLYDALTRDSRSYLLITSALPADNELDSVIDGAYYQLIRRGGFVQSGNYAQSPRKKDTQYFLSSGSVLQSRFQGGLWDVGSSGSHPVYRYSKPLFLGVEL